MTPGRVEEGRLEGVFPIVTTPFGFQGDLDLESLGRVVEHVVEGGAAGLVYPAIASEYQTLSRAEWTAATRHVVEVVDGRIPLIVGVSSPDGEGATFAYAEMAASLGAAATMWMPGVDTSQDIERIIGVTAEIARLCPVPLILQNAPAPLGPALDPSDVARVVNAVPGVRYVKEETQPCGQRLTRLLDRHPEGLIGVFGGAGGRFVLDELARGAVGSMPACEFTALHVAIFSAFRHGDMAATRALFNALLPLLNFGSVFRTSATKEILHRMGIIGCPAHRDHNPQLDAFDLAELTGILSELQEETDGLAKPYAARTIRHGATT